MAIDRVRGPRPEEDVKKVCDVLRKGGIAIIPTDLGYLICTTSPEKIRLINQTKGRGAHKRNGWPSTIAISKEVQILSPANQEVVRVLDELYHLPFSVITYYNKDHPALQRFTEEMLNNSTLEGKMSMLLNSGTLSEAVATTLFSEGQLMMGSSANLTETGGKHRLEDVQPELKAIADIIIDYGLCKFPNRGRATTMLDLSGDKPEVCRIGACYETIKDQLERHFGVEAPEDEGYEANPWGHIAEKKRLAALAVA